MTGAMKFMLDNSNLPIAKWKDSPLIPEDVDIESFKRLAHIKDYLWSFFYEHGHHLLICGKNLGCGKTSWAIKLMLEYFSLCEEDFVGIDINELEQKMDKGLFIPTVKFLVDMKQFGSNEKSRILYDRSQKSELVIFDDIAAVPMSKYDYNILYAMIDTRIFSELPCIFTSNATSKEELAKELGPRIADRIWKASLVIELKGRGQRGVK